MSTHVATFFAWATQANTGSDGQAIFPVAKVKLVQDAVYATCDEKDGVRDGIISDPRTCDFKPSSLQCKASNAPDCLTGAEVGVLERWYRGPVNSRGQTLYPGGIPMGSEPHWPLWLTGLGNAPALLPLFAQDFLRYMAFEPRQAPRSRPQSSTSTRPRRDWPLTRGSTMLQPSTQKQVRSALATSVRSGKLGASCSSIMAGATRW